MLCINCANSSQKFRLHFSVSLFWGFVLTQYETSHVHVGKGVLCSIPSAPFMCTWCVPSLLPPSCARGVFHPSCPLHVHVVCSIPSAPFMCTWGVFHPFCSLHVHVVCSIPSVPFMCTWCVPSLLPPSCARGVFHPFCPLHVHVVCSIPSAPFMCMWWVLVVISLASYSHGLESLL